MKKLFLGPGGRDKSTAHLGRYGGGVRAEAHSGPPPMGASIFSHLSFNSDALDCVAAGDTSSQPGEGMWKNKMWRSDWKWSKCPYHSHQVSSLVRPQGLKRNHTDPTVASLPAKVSMPLGSAECTHKKEGHFHVPLRWYHTSTPR